MVEFTFTASVSTDLAINAYDSSTFDVYDVGGSTVTFSIGSTTQHFTWGHGGTLAAGTHDIRITSRTGFNYMLLATGIRLSSASGASCCTDMPAFDGTYYVVGNTPFSNYSRGESALLGTNGGQQGYGGCFYSAGSVWSVRWYGSGWSSIIGWVYGASGVFKVYKDGVYQSSGTAPGGTKWSAVTMGTGLDTGFHLWEVVAAGSKPYLYELFAPVGATVGPGQPPTRPFIVAYGDSIVAGIHLSGYSTDETGLGYDVFPTLNVSINAYGVSGQVVSTCANGCIGTTGYLRDHTGNIVAIAKPSILVVEGSVNDEVYACSGTCTANPSTTFNTDYVTMLTNAAGNMQAGGIIIALGVQPFGGSTNNSSTIANWRAAIKADVATYNATPTNGVLAFYVDTTGWWNVNTTDMYTDLLHPMDAGYSKEKLQLIPTYQGAIFARSAAWF